MACQFFMCVLEEVLKFSSSSLFFLIEPVYLFHQKSKEY